MSQPYGCPGRLSTSANLKRAPTDQVKYIDGKALGLTWFEECALLDPRETSDLPTHLKRARGRAEKKIAAREHAEREVKP